jgi:hypothetical protein
MRASLLQDVFKASPDGHPFPRFRSCLMTIAPASRATAAVLSVGTVIDDDHGDA